MDDDRVYLKYYQAAAGDDIGKFMSIQRNPKALWFNDYESPTSEKRVR